MVYTCLMSKDFEVSVIFFCAKNGQRFMMKGKYIHCKHSWLLLAKETLLWYTSNFSMGE